MKTEPISPSQTELEDYSRLQAKCINLQHEAYAYKRQRDKACAALRGLLAWFEKTDKVLGPCPPEEELLEVNEARAALNGIK